VAAREAGRRTLKRPEPDARWHLDRHSPCINTVQFVLVGIFENVACKSRAYLDNADGSFSPGSKPLLMRPHVEFSEFHPDELAGVLAAKYRLARSVRAEPSQVLSVAEFSLERLAPSSG
jgi:hypothetical protein